MRKIVNIVIGCLSALTVFAVPARRDGIVRTLPDGTQKTVYLHGNEHFHFLTDSEDRWLDERTLEPLTEDERASRLSKGIEVQRARRVQQETQGIGDEPNIAPRGLLILVNFSDIAFSTHKDTIDSMLNGNNFTRTYSYSYLKDLQSGTPTRVTVKVEAEGSARRYFQDQSYGQYNPVFDVVGPVTLDSASSYYGANDSQGNDMYPNLMVKEACELADEQCGVDFTQYDNDGDGKVDFVYVVYAGFGEADGGGDNTIWPHKHQLSASRTYCRLDGKRVDLYACGSELSYFSKRYAGIGTFCHEFCHVLGLPDLYETNYNYTGIHTLFQWDILDYGAYNNDGNTPPAYSAYERFYMGWLTPRILSEPEYVALRPINEDKGESLLICEDDNHNLKGWRPSPSTFYLLETRTKSGWDKSLPGEGLLITRIKYSYYNWSNNQVNNVAGNMGVDIIEATSNTSNQASARDAYPAGGNAWRGYADHEVTDITTAMDGSVLFSYRYKKQGLENVQSDKGQCTKVIENGRLYLIYKGTKYNVQGQVIDN